MSVAPSAAMAIDPKLVKKLRDETGAGMMDCKKALAEAGGDPEKAKDILRVKGAAKAANRAGRATSQGVVASYIHTGGKVGVLIEVNCETDFVARNDTFREFVKDITLQIAASQPIYVCREEIAPSTLEKEKEIYRQQVPPGKPAAAVEKIVEGKLEKFYSAVCLMEQAFVKNQDITIKDLLTKKIAEIGENIIIRRFVRFQVGETAAS